MTMTTHIRFLYPVDPRLVWKIGSGIIGVPEDYRWERLRRGEPAWPGSSWMKTNDEWRAEPGQGAGALMWMMFGHEGALLVPEPPDEELDGTPIPGPPPAYVELSLDSPYGLEPAKTHDDYFVRLALHFGVDGQLLWNRGECCGDWHDEVFLPGHCGRYR